MRLSILAAAFVLSAGVAAAVPVDLGSQSASDVQKACKGAKGKFWVSPGGHDFGCEKKNCDGKGGSCTVVCTGGGSTCEGNTPARVVGGRLGDVLRGSASATGLTTQSGGTQKLPSGGLLDSSPGLGTQGPSAIGTPSATTPSSGGATPAGRLY